MAQLFFRLFSRYRWLHAPVGLLVMLLQRTPAVRLADQMEWVAEVGSGNLVRSLFTLGALGAFNSLAGASGTVVTTTTDTGGTTTTTTTTAPSTINFSVTNATPANGPAGTVFGVVENLGAMVTVDFSVSGNVTNPKSWSVTGNLPDGLSVVGGNPVNVGAPYKLTISGVPTVSGTWTLTLTAYDGLNETGSSNSVTCNLVIGPAFVTAPAIVTQPADVAAVLGGSATITAVASGSPTPNFQWYHDGLAILGQTSSTLTLNNLKSSDAGKYTMTATTVLGTVTTSSATLTVNAAAVLPSITTQPQGAAVAENSPVTLSVSATGTIALTYQWYKNGIAISGATSSSYQISNAHSGDAGSYTVTVTNSAGVVTSSPASLTVSVASTAPVLLTQPQSTTAAIGAAVNFSASASSTAGLSYQWSKDGSPLAGATTNQYSIPSVSTSDAGSYMVTATNGFGSVSSKAAVLTVNAAQDAPIISGQPQSLTVAPGSGASFSVTAGGTAPFTYQWMYNGTAIANATGASYTNSSVQAGDAGNYTVVVTNSIGSATSQAAVLTVSSSVAAPVFVTQSTGDPVASGHSISFSATTGGNAAALYQWQVSTDGGSSWVSLSDNATYSGTQSAKLTVSNVTNALNGDKYRLIASNTAGATATQAISLSVTVPPIPGPCGIAIDSAGNLFVGDNSNNTIRFVTPAGAVSLLAGAAGQQGSADGTSTGALFRQPRAIALDSAENLYVADTGNSVIRKITPAGVVSTLAGSSSTQGYANGLGTAAIFNSPQALAVDSGGNVYVADTANSIIRLITPAGMVTRFAGTGAMGSSDGLSSQAIFNQPAGIALDSSGNVYVADTFNNTIRKVDTTGNVTTVAGTAGVGGYFDGVGATALFNQPTGLVVDGTGKIYVADTGNEIIRVVATDGTVSTLAGLPTIAGLLDGNGSNAWFNQPKYLSRDSSGNLYVTDIGNAAIRKITPTGDVTTLILTQTSSMPAIPTPTGSSGSTTTGSTSGSSGTTTGGAGGGGAVEPGFVLALLVLAAIPRRRQMKRP